MSFFGPDFDMDDNRHLLIFPTPEGMPGPLGDHRVQERYTLMQFTGLLDKNGKEIYEGDIVLPEGETKGFVVEWTNQNDVHGFLCVRDTKVYQFRELAALISCDHLRVEIIGSIYESHELLK